MATTSNYGEKCLETLCPGIPIVLEFCLLCLFSLTALVLLCFFVKQILRRTNDACFLSMPLLKENYVLCPSFDFDSVPNSDWGGNWDGWAGEVQADEDDDDDESMPMFETPLEKFFALYRRDWKNRRMRVS